MKQSFIAWIATAALIAATTIRAFNLSHDLDLLLTFIGCGLWAVEGFQLKNVPLIATNIFGNLIILIGKFL